MATGFTRETFGRIVIHKFLDSSDESIDAWADDFRKTIDQTPPDRCFYILVDVAGPHVGFTAHARQTSKELFTHYRHRRGYLAFLFEWRTSPYFARLFFASLGKLEFRLSYFSQQDKALAWLHEAANSESR